MPKSAGPLTGVPRAVPLPERAQVVLAEAIVLAATSVRAHEAAMDLFRAADHDDATLTHAVRLGRSRLQLDRTDASMRHAVDLLVAVIALLGSRGPGGEVGGPARRKGPPC
jgi:hypothetical protein